MTNGSETDGCREQIIAALGEEICGIPVANEWLFSDPETEIYLAGPIASPTGLIENGTDAERNSYFVRHDAKTHKLAIAMRDEICERLLASEMVLGDSSDSWLNNTLGPRDPQNDPRTICVEAMCQSFKFPNKESFARDQVAKILDEAKFFDHIGVRVYGYRPEGIVLPKTSPTLSVGEFPNLNQDNKIPLRSVIEMINASVPCDGVDHIACREEALEIGKHCYQVLDSTRKESLGSDWDWLGTDNCEVDIHKIYHPVEGFCGYYLVANWGSYRLDA